MFLLTDGTAELGGLSGTDQQFDLQSWVQRVTDHVPNAVVALVGVFIVLAAVLLRIVVRWSRLSGERPQGQPDTTRSSTPTS